jgi:hypothetical protein
MCSISIIIIIKSIIIGHSLILMMHIIIISPS